jgi:hypothetical protein
MWYPRQCHCNLPDSERTVIMKYSGDATNRPVIVSHCVYVNGSYTLTSNWMLSTVHNKWENFVISRDFRFPPRSTQDLRSSGLLRSEWCQFLTGVSGTTYRPHLQRSRILGPTFGGQEFDKFLVVRDPKGFLSSEDGTDRLNAKSVKNCHYQQRNNPEEPSSLSSLL